MIQVVNQLPLYAATERIEREWNDRQMFTVLGQQALYTNWLCWKHTGLLTLITSIHRPDDPPDKVHRWWRGLDQVPVDGNGVQVFIAWDIGKAIEARVRLAFPYSGSPGIGSCLWHNVVGPSPGKGDHWHQQAGFHEPNYKPVQLKTGG